MDPAWAAPAGATLHDLYELSPANPGRSSIVHSGLSQAEYHSPAPWALVRHAPVQSDAMDACLTPGAAYHLASLGGCDLSQCRGLAPIPWGGVPACALGVGTVGNCSSCHVRRHPPFCHDGTERPIPRPN